MAGADQMSDAEARQAMYGIASSYDRLAEMAMRIGFRMAEGLAERVVYREFFPRGLTALDDLDDKTLGTSPSPSHVAARQEVMGVMEMIKLPLDERGQQRAAAQAKWILARGEPLEIHDIIAE